MRSSWFLILVCSLLLAGCGGKSDKGTVVQKEDPQAKKLLQGIWVNDEDFDVAFMVKGDSIFYADSTSQPVSFKVVHDTLIMQGAQQMKYKIVKQAAHLFQFKNQNGDLVKLVKSDNPDDKFLFGGKRPSALNQKQLIKRDSVIPWGKDRYHLYVQVNPTSYKVYKSSYTDEGVEVENVYYDNILHLSVYFGAKPLYSNDFRKNDFRDFVPADFLKSSILSDMVYTRTDSRGFHFDTSICMPDSPSSYVIDVCVDFNGKMTMKVVE